MPDLLVLFTRFRELPDEQMKHIVDYVDSGQPGRGDANFEHTFDNKKSEKYAHYTWQTQEWEGGFGNRFSGETWINHHGQHGKQGTTRPYRTEQRRIIRSCAGSRMVMCGDPPGRLRCTASPCPVIASRWCWDEVLTGHAAGRIRPVAGKQNDPDDARRVDQDLHEATRQKRIAKVFTTTMGASQDLSTEGTRRLLVNACLWAVGQRKQSTHAEVRCRPWSANTNRIRSVLARGTRGVKPADHAVTK